MCALRFKSPTRRAFSRGKPLAAFSYPCLEVQFVVGIPIFAAAAVADLKGVGKLFDSVVTAQCIATKRAM